MNWFKRMSDPERTLTVETKPVDKLKPVTAFTTDAGKLYATKEDFIYDVIVGRMNVRTDESGNYYPMTVYDYVTAEKVKKIVVLWEELKKEIE